MRATVLVFSDPRSRELLERIERLAPSDNALVIGETGTGGAGGAPYPCPQRTQRRPFVAVNCGAFAESLVESELFGHEKGAFTGALQSKAGWFEAANGGTLFLDEIGDLPPSIQVAAARAAEREVVRLGSRRPIPIDVRLVAATNVDLADAVVAGHFRETCSTACTWRPSNCRRCASAAAISCRWPSTSSSSTAGASATPARA